MLKEKDMKYYIGIDFGGTNVRVAKVVENGNIVQDEKAPSHGIEGPRELVCETIFSLLDKIDGLKETEGIGIGVPGPVDVYNRVMTLSSNLKDFTNYPLAKMIEDNMAYLYLLIMTLM